MHRLNVEQLADAAFNSPQQRRPVANVSFALNYYLHQYRVSGYHLVNIGVHGTVGIILYFFFLQLIRLRERRYVSAGRHAASSLPIDAAGSDGLSSNGIAMFAALLWLVHPLNTQAVTYIVQRMTSLGALFFVLTILLYGLARQDESVPLKRHLLFVGAVLCGALALGSKENTIMLPVVLLVYEAVMVRNTGVSYHNRAMVGVLIMALMLTAFILWLFDNRLFELISATYANRDFTLYQRLLTELRVLGEYIQLFIFPHPSRLNLDHFVPLSLSWTQPISTLGWGACFLIVIIAAARSTNRHPIAAFAVFWFFLNLAVESSVLGLELMFEHRMYLPSMICCLVLVMGANHIFRRRWIVMLLLGSLILTLAVWTMERNSLWREPMELWRDAAMKSAEKARPQNKLGALLEEQGRLEEAKTRYEKAISIDPSFTFAYFNLGNVFRKQGRFPDAIDQYERAVAVDAKFAPAYANLGVVYAELGDVDIAEDYERRALQIDPHNVEAYTHLGSFLAMKQLYRDALGPCQQAIALKPAYPEAHVCAADALFGLGDVHAADTHYRKALALDYKNPAFHYNYAIFLTEVGRLRLARRHYELALAFRPDFIEAHNNLGITLFRLGEPDKAVIHFRSAVQLDPDNLDYRENLERAVGVQAGGEAGPGTGENVK